MKSEPHKKYFFFKLPHSFEDEIKNLKNKPAKYWRNLGQKKLISLSKYVIKNVPAYQKLLKKTSFKKLNSISDFNKLPLITKSSYLRNYDYPDLFPKKTFFDCTTYSATSGSTGEPFYFPRNEESDEQYRYIMEIFFKNQFEINHKKTLVIMGFALGIWIGGIFTYKNLNKISQSSKYKLTVIPTGTNRTEFLRAIKKFGSLYDQVILAGYPPFIKDILDSAKEYKIKWTDYSIKILTAAEGFSERFRYYLAKKSHLNNPLTDIINIYGTVELGTMANETSFSNLIRHLATKNRRVFKELFPNATNIPTLAQYFPHLINFESFNGELVASGYGSAIPLIKYHFSDLGGAIDFEEMIQKLKKSGVKLDEEFKKYKINKKDVLKLPFVWTYARSDNAVVFRGANIFPGEIQHALDNESLENFITGRFTLVRKEDRKLNQILEINIELKKNSDTDSNLSQNIMKLVIQELLSNNSEFRNEYNSHQEKATPVIKLWPFEDPKYFNRQGKQKWVKK